jgi:hypothetical protein
MWLLSTRLLGPTREKIGMKRTLSQFQEVNTSKQLLDYVEMWQNFSPEQTISLRAAFAVYLKVIRNEVLFKCDR